MKLNDNGERVKKLIDQYKETETGRRLLELILRSTRGKEISKVQGEMVYRIAAEEYINTVSNPRITDENELKVLLTELPEIFSLLDTIVMPTPVIKSVILVLSHNTEEVISIFNSKNAKYDLRQWSYNGNRISIFIHHQQFKSSEDVKTTNDKIGREIWLELEDRRIKVGFYGASLNSIEDNNHIHPWFMNLRALGINSKIKQYASGFREDLEKGFRSSWEANIARLLDYQHISWEYEKESFPLSGDRFSGYYFPDFFLENNRLIEIKGFWDYNSRQKVIIFNKQYPDYQLLLLDGDIYIDLERLFIDKVPLWEPSEVGYSTSTVQVVGINRPERIEKVKPLGQKESLYFKRDSNNQYDKNAIMVNNKNGEQVGFVSVDWTAIIAPKLDLGIQYSVSIKEIRENAIDVDVFRSNQSELIVPEYLIGK